MCMLIKLIGTQQVNICFDTDHKRSCGWLVFKPFNCRQIC